VYILRSSADVDLSLQRAGYHAAVNGLQSCIQARKNGVETHSSEHVNGSTTNLAKAENNHQSVSPIAADSEANTSGNTSLEVRTPRTASPEKAVSPRKNGSGKDDITTPHSRSGSEPSGSSPSEIALGDRTSVSPASRKQENSSPEAKVERFEETGDSLMDVEDRNNQVKPPSAPTKPTDLGYLYSVSFKACCADVLVVGNL